MVVQNALFFGRKRVTTLVIPWCTYPHPELAHVGMKWDAADRGGDDLESITIPLHDVHLRQGSDSIVAATLVANHAGDIIGQLSMAMQQGLGLSAIGGTVFPYPTVAEVIRKAADTLRKRLVQTDPPSRGRMELSRTAQYHSCSPKLRRMATCG